MPAWLGYRDRLGLGRLPGAGEDQPIVVVADVRGVVRHKDHGTIGKSFPQFLQQGPS
jgi:hypothetical protein